MKSILITGGAGFIGTHVVRHFVERYPDRHIVNLDKLTYAASREGLAEIEESAMSGPGTGNGGRANYTFVEGDVCDAALLARLFAEHDIDGVVHLAAESHVDRSIGGPTIFAQANVMGTLALLEAARAHWNGRFEGRRFHQISTDEVYGALEPTGRFTEQSRYDPHSPYSASKAAADHFVRAYHDTYGLETVVSNCTNNYGPGQHFEKLIPLTINNIIAHKPLPIYGDGSNVREWIWVADHVEAIDAVFHRGVAGETYLVGGGNEVTNIEMVRMLVRLTDSVLGRPKGASEGLITFVEDRAGHDFRYAVDSSKIARELGWQPRMELSEGLRRTVEWYVAKIAKNQELQKIAVTL